MFFNTMMLAAVAAEEATSYTFREETGFDHSTNLALTLIASQLAISGDGSTALVSHKTVNSQTGSVAFFTKSGTSWNYAAQRSPSISGIRFGSEIALSEDGSTALIGAERENNNRGAVYVYANTGSSWQQQAKLSPAGNDGQYVGQSNQLTISADGNTAVISSLQNPSTGMTWVYTRSGTTWTLQQRIYGAGTGTELAGGTTLYDSGSIVELSGDGNTLAMRMQRYNSSGGTGDWGVRVYTRSGNTFSFAQDLDVDVGGQPIATDISVSSDGSYIVVGVDNGKNASNTETGGVEVYKKSGSTWSLSTTLFPSDGAILDDFGRRVQVSGDGKTVAVGAPRHSSLRGAIYVYRRDGLTWTQDQKLQHANIASNDDLTEPGLAMADSGHTILANMNGPGATVYDPMITYTKEFEAAYPSIATGSYAISFAENSTATVETYTANGATPITWSVTGTDASAFSINNSGELTFVTPPDFENPTDAGSNNVYNATITATNSFGSASEDITVTVTDADEIAPVITLVSQANNELNEETNSTLIASFSVLDDGVTMTTGVSLAGSPNAQNFTLTYNSGTTYWDLATASSGSLGGGVSADTTFTFTVSAQDAAGNVGSAQCTLVVLNTTAPAITGGSTAISIAENTSTSTVLSTYTATGSPAPTWSVSGNDASSFAINSSGELTFATSPDFENPADLGGNNVYDVTVVATNTLGSDTLEVDVTVTDVDDTPPVVTKASSYVTQITEYPTSNTLIAGFTASDAGTDVTQNLTLSVSPNGTGFYTQYASGEMQVWAQSGANLGGGVDSDTAFTLTMSVADANGNVGSASHSLTVQDKLSLTGATFVGEFTSGDENTVHGVSVNGQTRYAYSHDDMSLTNGSSLYLMDADDTNDKSAYYEVSLSTGRLVNGWKTLGFPTISSGQLGSLSSHRKIEVVWVYGSYFYGISGRATHNNYNAPCLWRASLGSSGNWSLLGQVGNWPSGENPGYEDRAFSVGSALYMATQTNPVKWLKITGFGSTAGSVAATNWTITDLPDSATGRGVAVCTGPNPDLLIFANDRYSIYIAEYDGSTKVGEVVTADDLAGVENLFTPTADLNLGVGDCIVGSGNYMYFYIWDTSEHTYGSALFRLTVTNAASE